ncbi:hypothetical protein [Sulfitobacter profundi]|uniref:Uncharacterized protein n=1 Tax=Sulfitobacter profundi TaxID=2679961 RepID=A0ABW1Z3K3_9RHOB
MTYALSGALQAAVYDLLQSDPGLTAMIGDAVYDAVPGELARDLRSAWAGDGEGCV